MCNGFFAVAILFKQHVIFLRDRFGEKPLYFYINTKNQDFSAGSEIKALKVLHKGVKVDANELKRYSNDPFDFCQSEISNALYTTSYENIYELRPGHIFSLSLDPFSFQSSEWYDLSTDIEKYSDTDIYELLKNATSIRCESDAPGCFSLSGGVDSSLLVSLAKENGERCSTFSIISANEHYSELRAIKKVVGADIETSTLIDEAEHLKSITYKDIISNIQHLDYPYFDPLIVQDLLYSRMKAANYKFTIDGHGADELFSGYQWHFPEIIAGNVARGKMIDAYRPLRYFLNSFPDNYSQISKLVTLMRGIKHYFFIGKILRIWCTT